MKRIILPWNEIWIRRICRIRNGKVFALYPLVIQPLASRRLCSHHDVLLCPSILSHACVILSIVKSIPLAVMSIF
jgi:hypothetical protein